MTQAIAEVAELVRRETGIVLAAAQAGVLRAAVNRAAPGLDAAGFLRAAADPVHGRALVDRLIDEATIQETTFARDRAQFDAIAWRDLLRRAQAHRSGTIRVWSAGCATGEECYTLALLASEAFAPARAPVDVLGTDISAAALAAAAAGRYRERAVHALAEPLRLRYLDEQDDGTFGVGGRLRALVRFRHHNLAHDPVPPPGETGFDLVVCRNVLIYFPVPLVARLVGSFERSLCPGGEVLLGAADALQVTATQVPPSGARAARPAPPAGPSGRTLRRPLLPEQAPPRAQRLAAAVEAADRGEMDEAVSGVESLLREHPLDADAHFIHGLAALEAGLPALAVEALRRALYLDDGFALAAFTLGRAYDTLGDRAAARRAYERALRTLDPDDDTHELLLQQVDIGDIAAACRARLEG
jgi:chemotaxis protein methyltransferase CheR